MGIMGCATNPLEVFNYPVTSTSDVEVSPGPNFPHNLYLTTEDSLAWVPFTPTFAGMTLGDARNDSRYRLVHNSSVPLGLEAYMDIAYIIRFGSTSTYSATPWQVSLPLNVNPHDYTTAMSSKLPVIGQWQAYDSDAGNFYEGRMFLGASPSATPGRFQSGDDFASQTLQVQQGTPFTFAAGDRFVGRVKIRVED